MNTPVLLLLLCCVAAQGTAEPSASRTYKGQILYAMAPEDRGSYYVNTKSGRYNYGYNTGDGIAKVEVKQPDGAIVGSYRYYDPTGKQVVRSYVADKRGFRVLGNDLPISPDTPVSHLAGLPAFTGAVEGTSEFEIPPPLGAPASQHQQQYRPHKQHLHKEQKLLEQQLSEYQKQQEKLEGLRQRLRELEMQQLRLQQKGYGSSYDYYTYDYQHPAHHLTIRNHLTHGYTSPYRYFDRDIDYDFPAGFAYAGLPTIVDPPRRRYPQADYIIGRAR